MIFVRLYGEGEPFAEKGSVGSGNGLQLVAGQRIVRANVSSWQGRVKIDSEAS